MISSKHSYENFQFAGRMDGKRSKTEKQHHVAQKLIKNFLNPTLRLILFINGWKKKQKKNYRTEPSLQGSLPLSGNVYRLIRPNQEQKRRTQLWVPGPL
jgi:hypothetical protein